MLDPGADMGATNGVGDRGGWLRKPAFNGGPEPWWVRILERLGLPTFLLLVLIWGGYHVYIDARAEWTQRSSEMQETMSQFTVEQRLTNAKLEELVQYHRRIP